MQINVMRKILLDIKLHPDMSRLLEMLLYAAVPISILLSLSFCETSAASIRQHGHRRNILSSIRQQRPGSVNREYLRPLKIPGNSQRRIYNGDRSGESDCPERPSRVPPGACAALPCRSTEDCESLNDTCCFNGCIFSCSLPQLAPPLIDWMTQTSEDSGVLLEDVDYEFETGEELVESHHGQPHTGEICTTTIDDDGSLPLACPHGYICHVENQGNPDQGVPNSGRCMQFDADVINDVFGDEDIEYE